MDEHAFDMAGGMVCNRRMTPNLAKGTTMILYDYENQDPNWKFTMGDEKPAKPVGTAAASQETESEYRREMRELKLLIQVLKKKQESLSKLPPTDAQTSEITDAIDSGAYVSKEIEIGVKIRDLEKKLESAKKRFRFLFDAP
jgi:hypothetical protein